MLKRASLVFIGVIQKQEFDLWLSFRLNRHQRALRREVRVEVVSRGSESRKVVDVFEIASGLGTSGDVNSTRDGERDLFLVRVEDGRYHVVRDSGRSIFPVTTGPHPGLPLDESRPFWERIALMNFWIQRSDDQMRIAYPYFRYSDPGNALSQWRMVKLERGLVRHPSAGVRIPACRELLMLGAWEQDECWETLSYSDKDHLRDGGYVCCSASDVVESRAQSKERKPLWWWSVYTDRENRRLLTAVNDREARLEFCRLYARDYPGDPDTGCPADQPLPATIVTERGDVPLLGPWPR